MNKQDMPKWENVYGMVAEYPIILKDCDTKEPYLHYLRKRIKVSDLLNLEGWSSINVK